MKNLLILARPYQYIKNIFIFFPLIFGFSLFSTLPLIKTILAFICFSLLASAVYMINDIADMEEDRQHPTKKNRPLASGAVTVSHALAASLILAAFSLILATLVAPRLGIILLIYLFLNLAYTVRLKHVAILDISVIAIGFDLRLFAGSAASGVELSLWIILMTFLLALFLALAKRRDDVLLAAEGKEVRKNIDGYNLEFVNASMTLMASVVVVSYIFYTLSPEVGARFHTSYLYVTTAFVIIGILRYFQLTFVEQKSANPSKIVLTDRFLQLTILGWLGTFLAFIYT